jgi:Mor family transcriptional regulator
VTDKYAERGKVVYAKGLSIRWTRSELEKIAEIRRRKEFSMDDNSSALRRKGILKLHDKGWTIREITFVYGLRFSQIAKIIRAATGRNKKNRQEKVKRDFAIVQCKEHGMNRADIARMFNLSWYQVHRILKEAS